MLTMSAKAHAGLLRTILMQCGAGRTNGSKGLISLYDGTRPASPNDVVRDSPLATVPIKKDSIVVDDDGGSADCLCNEGVIHRAGTALWARVTNDGQAVLDLDVGRRGSTADITLSNVQLVNGAIHLNRLSIGLKF
jgi:hypothetical protein